MRVYNFQQTEHKTTVTFSADFAFETLIDPRVTKKRFYFERFKRVLLHPAQVLKTGLSTVHTVYITVPKQFAIASQYEEAFFLPAALFANLTRENLIFQAPVSAELAQKVTALRENFRITTPPSRITFQPQTDSHTTKHTQNAQFFSLGLDSFYTLLCNPTPIHNNHLIFVAGFDIPLKQQRLLKRVCQGIEAVATTTVTTPVFVESNLRDLSDQMVNWARFHVTALTTVGSLLKFQTIAISGESFDWPDWGLRYGVDQLFSRLQQKVTLVGHAMTRDQKVMALTKSPYLDLMLKHLRVCWKNILQTEMEYNCSVCQKCVRTQLTLLACGITHPPTFKPLDPNVIANIELFTHVRNEWVILYELLKKHPSCDPAILKSIAVVLEKRLLDYG